MKDGFIKVATATPKIKVADVSYNADSIITCIKEAAAQGVKLLALPELCITGYTCGDLFFQKALIDGAWEQLQRIKNEASALDIIAVVGLPMLKNGKLINAAAVLYHGNIFLAYGA